MSVVKGHLLRKFGAGLVDGSIELIGGFLGSYFGAMVAALVTVASPNLQPELMQSSMKSGFGIGFAFWAISISFVNRVLIQGISRSSIGKKVFHLELVSPAEDLSWSRMMYRWVLSIGSMAFFGAGYWYMLFNEEGRSFHDLVAGTEVVPALEDAGISVEYREPADTAAEIRERMVFSNSQAERPMATVIELQRHPAPAKPAEDPASDDQDADGTGDSKKAA